MATSQKGAQQNDGVTYKSSLGSNFSSLPNGSIVSSQSTSTVINQNSLPPTFNDRANSSPCQFTNESILDLESSSKQQRKTPAEAVLGVIAGLNNNNCK